MNPSKITAEQRAAIVKELELGRYYRLTEIAKRHKLARSTISRIEREERPLDPGKRYVKRAATWLAALCDA